MKKIVSLLLSIVLVFSLLPHLSVSADDLKGTALEKEMRALIELGVLNPDEKGNYNPGAKATRGQFASYISLALKLPSGVHRFNDVPADSTMAAQISAAVQAGIISGYTAKEFKPNQLITREQMALMINRALTYMKVEKKQASLNFTDQNQIKATASRDAIATMIGLNIVSGYKNTNGKGYSFRPFQNITIAESSAFIYRMLQLVTQSEPEPIPVPELAPTPTPAPVPTPEDPIIIDVYRVGTVDEKGFITASSKTFTSFEEANEALMNEERQVILYNDKVVKMPSGGIAFTTPAKGGYSTLYANENLSIQYGGVSKGNELEYVTSDAKKVTVKAAGKTVYVAHNDVTLYPSYPDMERSYYTANTQGDLLLKRYNHTTKAYVSTSTVGKAPASLKVNGEYYSWDGSVFSDKNGNEIGTYYQYFNMLPIRTSTNYTSEELDAVIMANLEYREGLYQANPKIYAVYKDATTKSKLIGLGSVLKEMETTYKMNALLVLAWAISESNFGMSSDAQRLNNLFGIEAYDNRLGDAKAFATAKDSIIALSNSYVNKNYVPLTGLYANAGILGNKARGINVRYATDPYWGQIIAGHMYLLDKAAGGKDFINNPNPYTLYETTTDILNVRSSPEQTATNKLFTYPRPGYIVTVLETAGEWSEILSDDNENKYAYVFNEYIKPLPIAK